MTIPVSVQQRIRLLDQQGTPWRAIARDLNVSRDTVRKYALMEDCSPKPKPSTTRPRKLDGFTPVIDEWLQADRFMPRKQRHTAKRVYDRLVTEKGFTGSYSAVQRYVKQWRQEHRPACDGFMELEWRPGVMQVDFGEAVVVLAGVKTKVHCLVASFPYSNKRYVVALPGENAQCVCEGLVEIFEHIGLVPMVLVMDNATGAAHRTAWDKITIVGLFQLFLEHYRIEARFCNPRSGWEKGSVENAVGFLRRNLMVPLLNVESYAQLSKHLLSRCDELGNDKHYRADESVNDLFEEDRAGMRPLPRVRFDAVDWQERRADKEGVIQVGSYRYLAGPAWRSWPLLVGLRAFDVEIRTRDGRKVASLPRAYGEQAGTVRSPSSLLPALARKPRAWGESPVRGDFPEGLRTLIDAQDSARRKATFRLLERVGAACGFDAACKAAEHIIGQGRPRRGSPEHHGQTDSVRRGAGRCSRARPERVRRLHENRRWRYAQGAGRREGPMSRIQNPAPDATRRRASTNRKMETIMRLARRLPLTRQVLADQLETATPSQMEFMDQWMNAEIESRERSKRSRLLKQAGFPAVKTLDGYDWENIRFPVDWGRRSLESLEFASRPEDVVMFGPPGTGKTHLAMALGRKACLEGMTVRFFTAAGLVMRLLHASTEGKLDREIASIGKARLLIIDELGYVPIDEEGSRLLFQVITNAYEMQSIVYTTNIEFSGWGRVFGDPNMAAAIIDRTVHHGRMLRFEGESYRRTHALMQ